MNLPLDELTKLKERCALLRQANKHYQDTLSEWARRTNYKTYPVNKKEVTKLLIEVAQMGAFEK